MELTPQDLAWSKEALTRTGLFAACSDTEIKLLMDGLEKEHYKMGSTILFQGEISSKLCFIETGLVSINVRKGKEKLKVAELGPKAFFGEISLLTPRAATATVKAEADTDIIFLAGELVQKLVKTDPIVAEFINKKIEERLKSQQKPQDEEPPK
ncbi:MAG: cyclic nucleotide-binding domain-containing protein [Elusimicrobia bacterium]|nr:cyclic nucleotide-binding domain-containing protein [Candidatus Liberimonas magnetica]